MARYMCVCISMYTHIYIFCCFQSLNIARLGVSGNLKSLLPSLSPPTPETLSRPDPHVSRLREGGRRGGEFAFHSPRRANGRIERASSQRHSARFLISPLPPFSVKERQFSRCPPDLFAFHRSSRLTKSASQIS